LPDWLHLVLPLGLALVAVVVGVVLRLLGKERAAAGALAWAEWSTGARLYMLQKAVEKEPTNARLHCELGSLLLGLGRLDEAITALRLAASLAPEDARGLLLLGQALRRRGLPREAMAAFERCLERDPFGRQGRAARKAIDAVSRAMVGGGPGQ